MKIISLFSLLFIYSLSYSQSIKATFLHKFLNNKTDSIYSLEEKPILFSYTYYNKKSIYTLIDSEIIKKDSIKNSEGYYDLRISIKPSKNETFKDLAKNIFLREYVIYDTNFSVKDKLSNFEWQLIEEEKTIKGYKCKKAITHNEKFTIIAWYCEDIPINDGPDRFYGLPGFILKVELGEFSIIEIDNFKLIDEDLKIEKPINKSKYINLKQFKIDEIALYKKKANEN